MISTTLLIGLCAAGAVIIVALMMRRRRLSASALAEHARWRDNAFVSMLLSVAAGVGIARAQTGDGRADAGHSWHGSHLEHGSGFGSGSFGDGGGYGGDAGGGGL